MLVGASFVNPSGFLIRDVDPVQSFLTRRTREQAKLIENEVQHEATWQPIAGQGASEPFRPPLFLMVPVRGLVYHGDKGPGPYPQAFRPGDASVAVVCDQGGRRIELLTAPSLEWFQRVVIVPSYWCSTEVRIVAQASVPGVEVGFGTPFRVGWMEWVGSGPVGVMMALALALAVIALLTGPWLAAFDVPPLRRIACALLWPVAIGFVVYMVGYQGTRLPALIKIAVVGVVTPSFALGVRQLYGCGRIDLDAVLIWLAGLTLMGGLTLLTYVLLPLGNGSWLPNYAFLPTSWSTDNQLPVIMAKHLLQLGPGHPDYLGPWSITDRGVAAPGMVAILLLLLSTVGAFQDNPFLPVICHLFQVLIQACALPALLLILRDDGWTTRRLGQLAACLALSPFVFFNSFYVWPKLLPAILGLVGALLGARALRTGDIRALALAILCLGAGMTLHSGPLLALPPVAAFLALTAWARVCTSGWRAVLPRRAAVLAATAAGCLVVGALWSQARLAPQSSYGLTFLLTGEGIFGLDRAGAIAAARQFYATIGWNAWLLLKWQQVRTLTWPVEPFFASFCSDASWLSCMRVAQFTSLVPSYGPAPFLVSVTALLGLGRHAATIPGSPTRDLRWLALACMAQTLLMIAVFNMPMVVHHIPYTVVITMLIALMTWLPDQPNGLASAAVLLQAINLGVVWYIGSWLTWVVDFGIP